MLAFVGLEWLVVEPLQVCLFLDYEPCLNLRNKVSAKYGKDLATLPQVFRSKI